jgi:hypothetical protein
MEGTVSVLRELGLGWEQGVKEYTNAERSQPRKGQKEQGKRLFFFLIYIVVTEYYTLDSKCVCVCVYVRYLLYMVCMVCVYL